MQFLIIFVSLQLLEIQVHENPISLLHIYPNAFRTRGRGELEGTAKEIRVWNLKYPKKLEPLRGDFQR